MTFQKDADETPVLFRKWPKKHGGDVDAYFPTILGTYEAHTCACYAHVGQHSSADLQGCIARTRPATPEEYADLKRELESAPYGYRLKVYQRTQRGWRKEREKQLRAAA